MENELRTVQEKVFIVFNTSLARTRSTITAEVIPESVVMKISKFSSKTRQKFYSF